VKANVFERFFGREVQLEVEARGRRAEHITGRLDAISTVAGASWLALDGGDRLVRANAVVEVRLAEHVRAERSEIVALQSEAFGT
jgi:hypothetical protein